MSTKIKYLVLADDDPDDQELLKELVRTYSDEIRMDCVSNGKMLMEMLNPEDLPDLLLLDLNMPLKCGLDCLHEIHTNKKLAKMPVVVLSTSRNEDDMKKCFRNGALLFFSKPWNLKAYKKLVARILETDWKTFERPPDLPSFIAAVKKEKSFSADR
jgi:CheY-like chemotaxis protein